MYDKEFEQLKEDLEQAYIKYEALQDLYKQQTGRRWVMPLYLNGWPRRPKSCHICDQKIDDAIIICPTCKKGVHLGCTEEFLYEDRCVDCVAKLRIEHA